MQPFFETIEVRVYELDTQGHLNSAVYHQYAEHARWKYLQSVGVTLKGLMAAGVGPAFLEETIKYQRELRAGDSVRVGCSFTFFEEERKVFRIDQPFVAPGGETVADLEIVCGLLDLRSRTLVDRPKERLSAIATRPDIFGGGVR